jgi:LPPG:FO 2-phospho-L-lactate transferase
MNILALAGGVGGAKLADGLAQLLPPEDLTIVVNTGDDFEHFGLYICPDLDTVCYTLAGLANPLTGWGRADETWQAMDNLRRLGAPDWFNLGDRDLATHLERTRRLKQGQPLSQITRDFCAAWGVRHTVLPMSDQPVRTMVDTVEYGELPFQEYFVKYRCEPRIKGFRFAGIESARPAPGVEEALRRADAIILCPSNPWVSIDPILRILPPLLPGEGPGVRVAVSPILGGKTVKGPAAKMFRELGIEPSAVAVAEHYRGLLTAFVLDNVDADSAPLLQESGLSVLVTDSLMNTPADRRRLAQDVLNFLGTCAPPASRQRGA